MHETTKCHDWRLAAGHYARYLRGSGIDIGAGGDPLRPPAGVARAWDVGDGDAQDLAGVPDALYDFAYSSHCLEHMVDVPTALRNWARVLRPGGHLYVVVPDYLLYEKLTWPSQFNPDHKHSFSLDYSRAQLRRANHWTPAELLPRLDALELAVKEIALQAMNFDYNRGSADQTLFDVTSHIYFIAQRREA